MYNSSCGTSTKCQLPAKLNKISSELTWDNVRELKYILSGIISDGNMEKCHKARDLFENLRRVGKLDEENVDILREILDLIGHKKLIKAHLQDMPYLRTQYISRFRKLMFKIGQELTQDDLESLMSLWGDELPAEVRESKCVWTAFRCLEKKDIISEEKLCGADSLEDYLQEIDREDLVKLINKELKEPETQPSMPYSATLPPTDTTQDYRPASKYPDVRLQSEKRQKKKLPELLTPDYFTSVPSKEMSALSLSPAGQGQFLAPRGLIRQQGAQEYPPTPSGNNAYRLQPNRSVSMTSLSNPENPSAMFSHRYPGNQPQEGGDHAAPSLNEQSMQYADNSMMMSVRPRMPMQHHDDTDIGRNVSAGTMAASHPQHTNFTVPYRYPAQSWQRYYQEPGKQQAGISNSSNNHYPNQSYTMLPLAGTQGRSTAQSANTTVRQSPEVAAVESMHSSVAAGLGVGTETAPTTSALPANSTATGLAGGAAVTETAPLPLAPPVTITTTESSETETTSTSSGVTTQINYPQSASESGSMVASNPTEETTVVPCSPSSQWKETSLGHRLKIFTYDQIAAVADEFKQPICCEGGFGNVYKGKLILECRIACDIAIKRMRGLSSTDQGEKQYKRERSVATVRHPFIVPVIGVCEEQNKPFCIVYPYMAGGDLKEAIDRKDSRLTWQKCVAITTQVSSALKYLHSHNPQIIHLDVKPGNILLDAQFNSRLGDVGLSKDMDPHRSRVSVTSSYPGTLGYQDPSMFLEFCQRPANDIYSLGVVMLRLFTGKPALHVERKKPYHRILKSEGYFKDMDKLLQCATKDIWPSDDKSESVFTRQFAELMCQCLEDSSEDRISTNELHAELKTLAQDARCEMYTEPADSSDTNLCVICYSNRRVPQLSLISENCCSTCDKVCLQCLLDASTNPLVCPKHGEAEPPIGHSKSFGIFIGGEGFHLDAKRLYNKFTNPRIGAIRKENAILMIEKSEDDRKPTPENILKQLSVIEGKMEDEQEASLIFYFSGHGSEHGRRLMCSSGVGLEASQLRQQIHRMNFTQLLIILDCCYAAQIGPIPSELLVDKAAPEDMKVIFKGDDVAEDSADEKFQENHIPVLYKVVETDAADIVEKRVPSKSPNYSVMQWSASKCKETSVGYTDGTSLFTKHIIEGLHGAKKCRLKPISEDLNPECKVCPRFRNRVTEQLYITLNELIDYVHCHVIEQVSRHNRSSQTPQTVAEENTRYRKIAYCKPPDV